MNIKNAFVVMFGLAATTVIATALQAQTKLPTLEEALELSRKSGVPILAMAGRKT